MIDLVPILDPKPTPEFPSSSFVDWRAAVVDRGILPIVAVTGSRGKTTVVHLLDAMLKEAGYSTATRTNLAVTVRGRRQRGEIAPWSAALEELARGSLDLAIEEIDWHTLHAMGLEPSSYPIAVITNVCGNKDACLIQGEARVAMASLPSVFEAVAAEGRLVVNGDDFEVSGEDVRHGRPTTRVCLSGESPALRAQLAAGEPAAWLERGTLVAHHGGERIELCRADRLPLALGGRAGFQLQNALLAAAAALELGIAPTAIAAALNRFDPADSSPISSFRVLEINGVTVVVDRPNPSWFLRSVLRSLRAMKPTRVITVLGRLNPVPLSDLPEVGRLLGRTSTHLVMHSQDEDPERSTTIRQGAALNHVPPVIVHTSTEGRALARALQIAKRGDILLVLADRPGPLGRALARPSARRRLPASFPGPG